jgi:hypothetical protein
MILNSFFTKYGTPITGLSPTIKIWEVTDTTDTLVINNDPLLEIGSGFYKYVFAGYDVTKNYIMLIDGGSTQPVGERYNISATQEQKVSTSNVQQIISGVWEEQASTHTNIDTTGFLLNQISADTQATNLNVNIALDLLDILLKYERNRTRIDKTAKTLTVYDDDNLTPIKVFRLKDSTGAASVDEVCERLPI